MKVNNYGYAFTPKAIKFFRSLGELLPKIVCNI